MAKQGLRLYSTEYAQQLFKGRLEAAVGPQLGMFMTAMVVQRMSPLVDLLYSGGTVVARILDDENRATFQSCCVLGKNLQCAVKLEYVESRDEDNEIIPQLKTSGEQGSAITLLSAAGARAALAAVMEKKGVRLSKDQQKVVWAILDQLYREGFVFLTVDAANLTALTLYFNEENEADSLIRLPQAV